MHGILVHVCYCVCSISTPRTECRLEVVDVFVNELGAERVCWFFNVHSCHFRERCSSSGSGSMDNDTSSNGLTTQSTIYIYIYAYV